MQQDDEPKLSPSAMLWWNHVVLWKLFCVLLCRTSGSDYLLRMRAAGKSCFFFLLLATPTSQVQPVALKTDWGSCQRKQKRIAQETRRVEHHRSMTINRDFSLIACICLKTNISFAQYFLIYSITTKINGNNKILQTRGLSQSFLSKMLLLQSLPIDISERLPHLVPSQTLNDVVNKNVMVILYSG